MRKKVGGVKKAKTSTQAPDKRKGEKTGKWRYSAIAHVHLTDVGVLRFIVDHTKLMGRYKYRLPQTLFAFFQLHQILHTPFFRLLDLRCNLWLVMADTIDPCLFSEKIYIQFA